jgi:hypothetical protein
MSAHPPRISTLLNKIAKDGEGDRISVRQIVDALGARGFSLLIVILGLPNSLPMPPPIALVSGFLMVAISLQLVFGRSSPWLPAAVLTKSLARQDVAKAVNTAMPWVKWIEKLARPRLSLFDKAASWPVLGFALLILSLGLVFALPVVGQIPIGIALCLVGLGLVEHDGYLVLIGFGIGLVGVAFSYGFLVAVMTGASHIL